MSDTYVFVGNRFFVLEEMLRLNLNVKKIYAVAGSYLEKALLKKNIIHIVISSKDQLIKELEIVDFDILISNGCPYILPVTDLAKENKRYINIHPSYLPDLRGADPQPGALLYGRDSGATCHLMDNGIDTGEIISQVKIPYSIDLDASLLYQLTFMAEKEAFTQAYKAKFKANKKQVTLGDEIYYSKKDIDLKIDFSVDSMCIYQKIKAFSNRSQGAYFKYKNEMYRVFDCEIVNNKYLLSKLHLYQDCEVVLNYEDMLLIKRGEAYLKLKSFDKSVLDIAVGSVLEG